MFGRPHYLERLDDAIRRSTVTALIGPSQSGKSTLARTFAEAHPPAIYFDLESPPDLRTLGNAELAIANADGLVVLDGVQAAPHLPDALRVLTDRPTNRARFLLLATASVDTISRIAQSLAERVEFIELAPLSLRETGATPWERLWLRGGFPGSFLADSEADSLAWREAYIRTFLERDLPQLGIAVPAPAMRRFWTMLAHCHGQTWNASELARSMGLSDKTVRGYRDILTGALMIRQLPPWHENIGKRQAKAPKVYLSDSGLLHSLLGIPDGRSLLGHPRAAASWEGFAIEQVLQALHPPKAYFWAAHTGAELGLFSTPGGWRIGVECQFRLAPAVTRPLRAAFDHLRLDHLFLIHPGSHRYPVHDKITAWPLAEIAALPAALPAPKSVPPAPSDA